MTTRKDILIQKYTNLLESLDNELSVIFPSLEDIDIVDLLYYFKITFTEPKNYEQVLNDLISINNISISAEQYNRLYPIVKEYIEWFNEFSKK